MKKNADPCGFYVIIMTSEGPFQPKAFYDSMIIHYFFWQ